MSLHRHSSSNDRPVSSLNNSTNFQIPSRKSAIVPIVAPGGTRNSSAVPDVTHRKGQKYSVASNVASGNSATSKPETPKDQHLPNRTGCTSPAATSYSNLQNPTNVHQILGADVGRLDVFTPNYIPLRLRAVNESAADLQSCARFPAIDFIAYVSTFLGRDFARPFIPAILPPPTHIQNNESTLTSSNYGAYWRTRLQNEFALQQKLYNSFTIYDQSLSLAPGRQNLYVVHVPGLRENAPRIDIGDIVHIRPLHANHSVNEAQLMWWLDYSKYQGMTCPGFTGLLYDPCVWEIDRTNEQIMLRIDSFIPNTRCNVILPLQESKLEPVYRAITASVEGNLWLRCMLFPEVNDGVLQTKLSQGSFDISWFDTLNWEQKKAVHTVVSNNYGTMPYLISGPPGTGKTKTIVETALQLIKQPGHLLICAPSDAAADTLALRLSVHLKPNELFRLNGWTRTFAEVPDRLLLYTHSDDMTFSLPPVQQLLSFRIVVTTCRDADLLHHARLTNVSLHKLFSGVQPLLNQDAQPIPLHWTALLLDEAAQATEPEALIALSVVMSPDATQSPQFIAAGDQYQLGPKLLSRSGLEISLFQRVFARSAYADHPLTRKNGVVAMTSGLLPMMRPAFSNLIRNYRSHPAILSVPSSLFYDDTLITERKSSQDILTWPGWKSKYQWPVLFQQNDSSDTYESVTDGDGTGYGSLYNPGEATLALNMVRSLLDHANQDGRSGLNQKDVMIMSPFRAQVTQLRKVFRNAGMFQVNIGPLEAFQGLESRIVIICTTRTRLGSKPYNLDHHVAIDKRRALGLIDEPQRLNVALTRAQEGLIVLGNVPCLISTKDVQWRAFLDFCRRNGCFAGTPHFVWPDLGDNLLQGRLEKALKYAELKIQRYQGQNDLNNVRRTKSDTQSRFTLKGIKLGMDEEMWQLKELAQSYDHEDIDLVLDEYNIAGASDTSVSSGTREEHSERAWDYDRNLQRDFHEECTTQ